MANQAESAAQATTAAQNARIEQVIPERAAQSVDAATSGVNAVTHALPERAAQVAAQNAQVADTAAGAANAAAQSAAQQVGQAASQNADALTIIVQPQAGDAATLAANHTEAAASALNAASQSAADAPSIGEKLAHVVAQILNALYDFAIEIVKFAKVLAAQPHAAEIFGAIAATLFVLYFVRKIYKRLRPVRLFNNSAGVVEVSRKALNELAESVCYGMGAMNKPDISIYFRRRRLCISVALVLEAGQSLTEIAYKLQNALTIAFREHLGVEKLGNVDVKILAFKGLVHKPLYKTLEPGKSVIPTEADAHLRRETALNIDEYQVDNPKR